MLKKSHCYIQVYRAILPYQNISRKSFVKRKKCIILKQLKMKKLIFGLIAIVVFGFVGNAQKKLSAEDHERLQEIVKKATSIAEEKKSIVTFDLVYKEGFTNNVLTVDEEGALAKELASSMESEAFNALKANVRLTFSNGETASCAENDIDCIGNNALKYIREGAVRGLYVPRSLESVGNAQFDVKNAVSLLAKDKNFVTFINNISKIPNETNIVNYKSIIKKKEINLEDVNDLAIAFGFKNLREAQKFDSENSQLLKNLIKDHSLQSLNPDELENLVESSIILIPEEQQPVVMSDCIGIKRNCIISSVAIYTIEAVGCVSAGVGLAGVTFWCGGCFGAAVGSACIAAASAHYYTMLQDCNFAYQDCNNN